MEIRIGQPYKRILVDAEIVLCKHPDKKYSDFSHFKRGHIGTYNMQHGTGGEEDWIKQYSEDYDKLPVIQSGDLILNGREDKAGGNVVVRLVDINGCWSGSGLPIYGHTNTFHKVILKEPLPESCIIEEDVEDKHRKK